MPGILSSAGLRAYEPDSDRFRARDYGKGCSWLIFLRRGGSVASRISGARALDVDLARLDYIALNVENEELPEPVGAHASKRLVQTIHGPRAWNGLIFQLK